MGCLMGKDYKEFLIEFRILPLSVPDRVFLGL